MTQQRDVHTKKSIKLLNKKNMAPVQSLNNWWFDIIDINQQDIDNIYLVLSSDKTKKSSRVYREPNEKNGIRYAVTGLAACGKSSQPFQMYVSKILCLYTHFVTCVHCTFHLFFIDERIIFFSHMRTLNIDEAIWIEN